MGLKIIKKAEAPVEQKEEAPAITEQKVTDAVVQFALKGGKVPLLLIHRHTGKVWSVVAHDVNTKRTTCTDPTGMRVSPVLTERENALYSVMWRD